MTVVSAKLLNAPTITTILARHYITKEKKNLYVTELGQVVNNIMMKSFPRTAGFI